MMKLAVGAMAAFVFTTTYANAQIAEVKLGITEHDVEIFGLGSDKGKENSIALNGEIVFEEPEFLKPFLSPQPWIGGTVNLEGETSYGGAGLLFRQTFAKRFYFDWTTGLVIHDGTERIPQQSFLTDPDFPLDTLLNNPSELTDAQLARVRSENAELERRQTSEIEFGSRILFRNAFTLGLRFGDDWAGEAFVEHLSHGQILASGTNEGLDAYGFRLARRF